MATLPPIGELVAKTTSVARTVPLSVFTTTLLLHCTLDGGVAQQAAASLGDRPRQPGEIFQGMKARLIRKAQRSDQILCVQSGRFARVAHGYPGFAAGREFAIELVGRCPGLPAPNSRLRAENRTRSVRSPGSLRSDLHQIAVYALKIARDPFVRLDRFDPIYRRALALINDPCNIDPAGLDQMRVTIIEGGGQMGRGSGGSQRVGCDNEMFSFVCGNLRDCGGCGCPDCRV
jgi:hypothetical protein